MTERTRKTQVESYAAKFGVDTLLFSTSGHPKESFTAKVYGDSYYDTIARVTCPRGTSMVIMGWDEDKDEAYWSAMHELGHLAHGDHLVPVLNYTMVGMEARAWGSMHRWAWWLLGRKAPHLAAGVRFRASCRKAVDAVIF